MGDIGREGEMAVEFCVAGLLYAFWEIKEVAGSSILGGAVPLAFLLLAPLLGRLRVRAGVRAGAGDGGLDSSLDLQIRLVPLEETLGFPKRDRRFCLGVGALLAVYLCGLLAYASAIGRGTEIPYHLSVLIHQVSVWGPFLLALLRLPVCRDTASALGSVLFAGELVLLCGIHRVLSWCSDMDAFPAAMLQNTLPWLLATLVYAALLAGFLRWRGKRRVPAA